MKVAMLDNLKDSPDQVAGWFGLALPARTPDAVTGKWSRELMRIMQLPDVAPKIAADGSQAVGGTPAEFAEVLKRDAPRWGEAFARSGVKPQE